MKKSTAHQSEEAKEYYKTNELDHSKIKWNHINSLNYLGYEYAWSSDHAKWFKVGKEVLANSVNV